MRQVGTIVWLLVLLICFVVTAIRFQNSLPIETDLFALLPDKEQSEWVRKANVRMKDQVTQRVVFLIKGNTFKDAELFATRLVKTLEPFAKLAKTENEVEGLGKKLFAFRSGLLSEQDRQWLENGEPHKVSKRALAQIMSPFGLSSAELIKQDPYLLFSAYLASRPKLQKNFKVQDGWNVVDEYITLSLTLNGEAFDQSFQNDFVTAYEDLMPATDITILKTGAIFYGQRGVQQGQNEASAIGIISILGIIFLNLFFLKSIRPLLLSLLAISSGVIGGMGICLLIFGKLHLMAFVFGAGLIGIAVDYAFHYFCDGLGDVKSSGIIRTKNIARPLTMGIISSSLGFLTLVIAPFPGLQQIAVFATSGLIMAYLCVMCVYPIIDKSTGIMHFKQLPSVGRKWSFIVAGVSIIGSVAGFMLFHIDDDVRNLQNLPVDLKSEEDQIRHLTGFDNATRLLLVKAGDEEATLQLEETLLLALRGIQKQGGLIDFQAMSQIIPSIKRQKEDRALVEKNLLGSMLTKHLNLINISKKADSYAQENYIKPAGLLQAFRLAPSVHLIRLSGVTDTKALLDLAAQYENVVLVDQAKEISDMFKKYRERALILLALACLLIWTFLMKVYGWRNATLIVSVPFCAVLTTPFIAAVFGLSFTFFNAMALLLVLAIGLDYALFSYEASNNKFTGVMLANGLSAASTIMAFGLLAFSNMYAIHSFGVTIFIGIFIAYALSPLVHTMKLESETL